MLEINNVEFFNFDIAIVDDYISINMMVDPQKFTLKAYKRSPFASVVIKSKVIADELSECGDDQRKRVLEILEEIKRLKMIQYNTYKDDEYDKIVSMFDNRLFHTILFYFEIEDIEEPEIEDASIILIGAYPVKGMIHKIPRSPYFSMYNGVLVGCKPYKFDAYDATTESESNLIYSGPIYYDKILYCLVEIHSHFRYQEFTSTVMESVGVLKDHSFYPSMDYINPEMSHKNLVIRQHVEETAIPVKGREFLFDKPCDNIFCLSDAPKDIMANNNILKIKLK